MASREMRWVCNSVSDSGPVPGILSSPCVPAEGVTTLLSDKRSCYCSSPHLPQLGPSTTRPVYEKEAERCEERLQHNQTIVVMTHVHYTNSLHREITYGILQRVGFEIVSFRHMFSCALSYRMNETSPEI